MKNAPSRSINMNNGFKKMFKVCFLSKLDSSLFSLSLMTAMTGDKGESFSARLGLNGCVDKKIELYTTRIRHNP